MSVSEGRARYEREIQQPGGPTGTFERGEGPVTPSGEITVATRAAAPGYSYEAEYGGRIDEGTAHLTCTQRWKLQRGSGAIVRSCSLEQMRVAR
jgi:hypothetical protein